MEAVGLGAGREDAREGRKDASTSLSGRFAGYMVVVCGSGVCSSPSWDWGLRWNIDLGFFLLAESVTLWAAPAYAGPHPTTFSREWMKSSRAPVFVIAYPVSLRCFAQSAE